jgi:hypothetical protein
MMPSSSPLSTTLQKPEPCSLHQSLAGYPSTAPLLLESNWAKQQKSVRLRWMKLTNEWRNDQLLVAHRHMDRLQQSTLTAPAGLQEESTVIVQNNAPEEQERRVSLSEPSGPASLMRLSASDAGWPCTTVNARCSLSSSADPRGWEGLVDSIRHKTMKKHPSQTAAEMRRPLQFKMKEEQKMKLLRGCWWRYIPHDKACVQDRQHTKDGEHALLLHNAP